MTPAKPKKLTIFKYITLAIAFILLIKLLVRGTVSAIIFKGLYFHEFRGIAVDS